MIKLHGDIDIESDERKVGRVTNRPRGFTGSIFKLAPETALTSCRAAVVTARVEKVAHHGGKGLS